MTSSPEVTPGIVVVDKPAGMTSHDVVARVRRTVGTRKVGHAGTLDPMATGVLVLGVGRATRLLGHLMLTEKSYDATVLLGATTTTDDAEGEVVTTTSAAAVTEAAVREALAAFRGEVDQVPSTVSAIKVGGKRAYARARSGEDVVLEPRRVTIHDLEVVDVRRGPETVAVDLAVRCSSGTYIRAIARDLGTVLGVGGHLTALRRTAVGPFTVERADTDLAQLRVVPLAETVRQVFPHLVVDTATAQEVRYGRRLDLALPAPGPVAVLDEHDEFLALYEQAGAQARPVAVFVG